MSDDLRQMADGFRLGTAPSDDDVNRANWIIDRQSACIDEIEAERDDLARRVAAYEEMAGMHEPGVLRRQMELRRLRVRAETAEAESARLKVALNYFLLRDYEKPTNWEYGRNQAEELARAALQEGEG